MLTPRFAPLLFLALSLTACSTHSTLTDQRGEPARPASWGVALADHPGLGNFHKISEALYRGEQPTAEGLAELRKMGIKTVVNLRTSPNHRDECERLGLNYVHIPSQAWDPSDDNVLAFLSVVTDPEQQPVFLHCKHGADRTGALCAIYRQVVQDWSKADSIREMTEGGYHFHAIWRNLRTYVSRLDVQAMKGKLEPVLAQRSAVTVAAAAGELPQQSASSRSDRGNPALTEYD